MPASSLRGTSRANAINLDDDEDVDTMPAIIDVRNGKECVICFEDDTAPAAFRACGHVCICMLCAMKRASLGEFACPICGKGPHTRMHAMLMPFTSTEVGV